jgi:hypothetical protein
LLETSRQSGEQRLEAADETERWRARHAGYQAGILSPVRGARPPPRRGVFWAVRLGAEQDDLLAAWSWPIGHRQRRRRLFNPGRLRAG